VTVIKNLRNPLASGDKFHMAQAITSARLSKFTSFCKRQYAGKPESFGEYSTEWSKQIPLSSERISIYQLPMSELFGGMHSRGYPNRQ